MHIAIIMDGNGRWATDRGLRRSVGHRVGADTVDRTVRAACERDVDVLTLYAFSSDNWHRPAPEVAELMRLFLEYLDVQQVRCVAEGIRINVIGRRDRLSAELVDTIERVERATARGRRMLLRLAVDYSAQDALVTAAGRVDTPDAETFYDAMLTATHSVPCVPAVDLLIRTGGEMRLSDFLLWECAYAEFVFIDRLWPDFSETDLARAMCTFDRRQRRFGRVVDGPGAGSRPLETSG